MIPKMEANIRTKQDASPSFCFIHNRYVCIIRTKCSRTILCCPKNAVNVPNSGGSLSSERESFFREKPKINAHLSRQLNPFGKLTGHILWILTGWHSDFKTRENLNSKETLLAFALNDTFTLIIYRAFKSSFHVIDRTNE